MSESMSLVPYVPTSTSEAMQIATTLSKSRMLGDVGTPEQAFLIMATGAEIGIPPTAALRSIHVIGGKAVLSSDLLRSLCLRSPVCQQFTLRESTESKATYCAQRKGGEPVVFSYAVEDAQRAGLLPAKPGSAWAKYPRNMLRHRCAAELAREVFPDVVLGMYAEGEIDERPALTVEAVDVTPLAPAPSPAVESQPTEAAPDWHTLVEACATTEDLAALGRRINSELPTGSQLRTEVGKLWKARKATLAVSDAA